MWRGRGGIAVGDELKWRSLGEVITSPSHWTIGLETTDKKILSVVIQDSAGHHFKPYFAEAQCPICHDTGEHTKYTDG